MGVPILTVRTDGFTMRYFRFGGGKTPFVILPGLSVQSVMQSAEAVEQAYEAMSESYTVYVFDRREDLPRRYSVEDMAEDTAAAMAELGIRGAVLFGASQGGMMALVIAIRHPELVGRMILGSTSSRVTEEQYRVLDRWAGMARRGERRELYLDFGERLYPPAVFRQCRGALEAAAESVTESELERFAVLAEGTRGFCVTEELGKVRCPVLAIGVFDDAVLGDDATMEIAEKLDGREDFRLYMYLGFGHAAFDTAPDYRKRVLDFLRD